MSEPKRKPLAALLVAEKEGPAEPSDSAAEEGDEEMMVARDCAMAMGAKDPDAAAMALIDTIRACMASKARGGDYSK